MYSPTMDCPRVESESSSGSQIGTHRNKFEIGGTFQENQIDIATALATYDTQIGNRLLQALQGEETIYMM
jgi:hypothetical protein